jgi:hypothetical protein
MELANQTGRQIDPYLLSQAVNSLQKVKSKSTLSISMDLGGAGLGVSRGRYNINSDA